MGINVHLNALFVCVCVRSRVCVCVCGKMIQHAFFVDRHKHKLALSAGKCS